MDKKFIKEALKINEEYLVEMSMKRADAIKRIESFSEPVNKHMVYLFVLGNLINSYNHWKNELSTYLSVISNITLKPNKKKLEDDVFYESLFPHIDTTADAKAEIAWAWAKHDDNDNKLPMLSDILTDELAKSFKLFKNNESEKLVKLFTSKEQYSKKYFEELIDSWGLND